MFSNTFVFVCFLAHYRTGFISLCCVICCAACGTANWRAPLESREGVSTNQASTTRQPIDPNRREYRIQAGDTLSGIAWRSQQQFKQIARLNNLHPPYLIRVGQVLRLRPTNTSTTSRPTKPAPPRPAKPTPRSVIRSSLGWIWPVTGKLFSTFKAGDAVRKGIKIAAKLGAPVLATEAGRVVYSGSGLIGYGPLVIIKHNADYLSAYGHNRKLLVKTGQQIKKGQKIAELGTANSGRSLLHFEIRRKGKPVDPLRLLSSR